MTPENKNPPPLTGDPDGDLIYITKKKKKRFHRREEGGLEKGEGDRKSPRERGKGGKEGTDVSLWSIKWKIVSKGKN